jgi:hypothetical protein
MEENMNKKRSIDEIVVAIIITTLTIFLALALFCLNHEHKEKQSYIEKYEAIQKERNDLAEKQAIDLIHLQECIKNMATDVVLANKSSESELVKKAIDNLEITVAAKTTPNSRDTIPKNSK